MGSIPESGRFPGEGNGSPLQYFCLVNPWTEEPGGLSSTELQKTQTQLSDQTTTSKHMRALTQGGSGANVFISGRLV